MKLSLSIFAAAKAITTDWIVSNWWKEAVGVFKFANENWAAFAAPVDAVS